MTRDSREVRLLHCAGLGLRRSLLADTLAMLEAGTMDVVAFFEVAPENWSRLGGRFSRDLSAISEHRPLACHGLSLNLGGSDGLDMRLLAEVKAFMRTYRISLYTEHLSWCGHEGQLYDLLPLPATYETVRHVAQRIAQVQDYMGEQIGIENASYYAAPEGAEMDDATFVREVVKEAGCLLHLDVNNVYVNSCNHGFDPYEYMRQLPLERTCYMHVAGHHVEDDGLIIDTHGMPVIDPVWQLLEFTYDRLVDAGLDPVAIPSCLERDFNFPPLAELVDEVGTIDRMQREASARRAARMQAEVGKAGMEKTGIEVPGSAAAGNGAAGTERGARQDRGVLVS